MLSLCAMVKQCYSRLADMNSEWLRIHRGTNIANRSSGSNDLHSDTDVASAKNLRGLSHTLL